MVRLFVCAALVATAASAQDNDRLARGTYLMNSIVACGNCHVQRGEKGRPLMEKGLSGGMVFDEQPFKAYAPNITPDPDTGVGKWTDAQLAKAIREGIRPDGSVIGPPMPIIFYRGMADEDLDAIVAYLRAQPPVKNAVPKSEYRIKLPPLWARGEEGERTEPQGPGEIRRVSRRAARPLHGLPYAVGERRAGHDQGRRRRQSLPRTVGRGGVARPHAARAGTQGLERC